MLPMVPGRQRHSRSQMPGQDWVYGAQIVKLSCGKFLDSAGEGRCAGEDEAVMRQWETFPTSLGYGSIFDHIFVDFHFAVSFMPR